MREKSKTPKLSTSKLKKKADAIYSQYLRLSSADKNGMCKCYTCSTVKHWKDMQCGHFVTRTITALRFDPRNTKPQEKSCNIFNQGRLDVFATNLVKEYGVGILDELQEAKKQRFTAKQARELYERVIEEYTKKFEELSKLS